TLHSFQGTLLSLQRAESVTHVSGMNCHPSLGKGTEHQGLDFLAPHRRIPDFGLPAVPASLATEL
ncbi:hypothetical protein NKH54_30790, partial [Mesorhizobium sp. M1004]|uniref:hypothetical protein n=1 Tax=Mesorhizobium sp. M1004 TaxID=2957046 RepID=UPI00333D5BD3